MTASVRVGCAGLPPRMGRETYFERLAFLEVDALARGASVKTLRKWRRMAPEAAFALWYAPSGFSEEEGQRLAEATEALGAEAVVVRSPTDFGPSAQGRDRLRRWFEGQARGGGAVQVWEPLGPWDLEQAARFAEELGVLFALDPLAPDPLGELRDLLARPAASGRAYYRPLGLGRAQRRYDPEDLEHLADLCRERAEQTWVAFGHIEKYRDALRFRDLVTPA